MIKISSDGPLIKDSNYWKSSVAAAGKAICTTHSHVVRVLLPPVHVQFLADIRAGQEVVMSRGPWPEAGLQDAIELMWDDRSEAPFALHLTPQAFVEIYGPPDPKDDTWYCTAWIEGPMQISNHVLRYRRVSQLPCMEPWKP